jgi:hypothetical protein
MSMSMRILWSIVSKAALRSSITSNVTSSLSILILISMSLWTLRSAVSVEWNWRYADWLTGSDAFSLQWFEEVIANWQPQLPSQRKEGYNMLCGDLFASPCLVLKLVYNGNCLLSWSLQELQKMIENKEEDLRRCKDLHSKQVSEFKDATQELQQNFAKVNIVYHYTRQNAQVVTNLQQTCIAMLSNNLSSGCVNSHCLFPACWQVVNGLLTLKLLQGCWAQQLQIVPTTCYRPGKTSCE